MSRQVSALAPQTITRNDLCIKSNQFHRYSAGLGNFAAVVMFPILMNYCQLGVTGAAISTVISQYVLPLFKFFFFFHDANFKIFRYIVAFLMIWYLNKRTVLLVPNIKNLHFGDYLKSGNCPSFSHSKSAHSLLSIMLQV